MQARAFLSVLGQLVGRAYTALTAFSVFWFMSGAR